uniref:Uncharacterized protein LOC113785502 n=1 Tax=Cicer arietinum TaxID=3827 RepID=A0A3Q7XV90_CICAR|nr:uncharacterized protein LOC113785502 [Cicer arietinum]
MAQPPGFTVSGTSHLGLRLLSLTITQWKYALDILEETCMLDCRLRDTPMDPNVKLLPGQGEPLQGPDRYRRLVGKLNYLTVTRPDIAFVVTKPLSDLVNAPSKGNIEVVGYSDADWVGSPSDRRSTSGYCVLVGGTLISWRSKKQNIVARSSAEAEYRDMVATTCELTWLKQLLKQLKL